MKAHFIRGHNPAPILRKGGPHQSPKEIVPELDYKLSDYYDYLEEGEVDSPESFYA
jgi:hypothetical protein